MYRVALVILSVLMMGYSCNQPAQQPDNKGYDQEDIIQLNAEMLRYEDSLIANFVEVNNMEMEVSRTGLRMLWRKKVENGLMPVKGSEVTIEYSMYLLDSTLVQSEERIQFKLDYTDVTNGLNEAVKRMKVDEEAFLIVPSHLGYGVHGKGNTVPSRATLLYNLKLIEIKS